MDLRDFVQRLLQTREMQVSELGERLGYQSKTSLVRLQAGNVSVKSLESFARRLEEKLELTVEERRELNRLVRCFRSGDYQATMELESFLELAPPVGGEIMLDGLDKTALLSVHYKDLNLKKITIFNCTYVPIYLWLQNQIRNSQTVVEQFILDTHDSAKCIHSMAAVRPIFYEKEYFGYTIDRDTQVTDACAIDAILVDYEDAEGYAREDCIIFDRLDHGRILTSQQVGAFRHLFGFSSIEALPIKRTYLHCTMLEDYIGFSQDMETLERDCAKLVIKPDLCLALMPIEVITAAFVDQCPQVTQEMLDALTAIYNNRFASFFHSTKPVHYIMKYGSLKSFMQTGLGSDHFWGMRAFTPTERIQIMENLIWNAENNPFFHAYLFKNDDLLRDIHLDLYEGKGILINEVRTQYDLADGYADVLLTQQQFMDSFKDYYLNELIKHDVMSQAEMLGCLHSMLDECKAKQ